MGMWQGCVANFQSILFDNEGNSARAEWDTASEFLSPADGSRTLAGEDPHTPLLPPNVWCDIYSRRQGGCGIGDSVPEREEPSSS